MTEIERALDAQIKRLIVLWPVLNGRPAHTQEIGQAIARHTPRITAADVTEGFSQAIENAPTTGWPPGPHEVLGCVLKAAETRKAVAGAARRKSYPDGITFAEWWSSLPESERAEHTALHRMMTKTNPEPTTPTGDEIEWEDAEWEEAA